MGAGDHTPLPEDAVPAGGHTDRFARRDQHAGETGQEQAEAHHHGAGREAGQGAEGSQVRGVFGSDAEGPQERIRRGHSGRIGAPRTDQEEEVQILIIFLTLFSTPLCVSFSFLLSTVATSRRLPSPLRPSDIQYIFIIYVLIVLISLRCGRTSDPSFSPSPQTILLVSISSLSVCLLPSELEK